MTEVYSEDNRAPQSESSQAVEGLGTAAMAAINFEQQSQSLIRDRVGLHSQRIYAELGTAKQEHGPTTKSDQMATSRFIYRFLQGKAGELKGNVLPEEQVIANVKALRSERGHIIKKAQRPAFMRGQKTRYQPITDAYADSYPEIHFAKLLRDELQANNDIGEAALVSEILIAMGRTIEKSRSSSGDGV